MCKELLIPPGTQNYVVRMRLYDTNKHLLCLTIRIILRAQGALKILISAPYWLINKTGDSSVKVLIIDNIFHKTENSHLNQNSKLSLLFEDKLFIIN